MPFAASPSKQVGFVEDRLGWSVGTHAGAVVVGVLAVTVTVVGVVVTVVTGGGNGLPILRSRPAAQRKLFRRYWLW